MKTVRLSYLISATVGAFALQQLAMADWLNNVSGASGAPVASCNPKDSSGNQSSSLPDCKVAGLPPAILTGYILSAKVTTTTGGTTTEGAPLTINSTNVGTRYDRVYCKSGSGTGGCDYSSPVIIATRLQMNSTASTNNSHCPTWSGTTSQCFEVNDFYRVILGTSSAEVSADIAYFMGTVSGGTDPDTALAFKYLEFAGKTNNGIWKAASASASAPGTYAPGSSSNRDAMHIMFQADTNAYDPDGLSSKWSPWLFVRQSCPNGYQSTTGSPYANRFYEGGEEGQPSQSISTAGFACIAPTN